MVRRMASSGSLPKLKALSNARAVQAISFDDMFLMSHKRASLRLAHERKDCGLLSGPACSGSKSSGTLNLSDDAMTMDQVLAGYATDGERLWAAGALRNIPGKHEGEEDTVHGRRHSFVEQLQHAVREVVNLRRVSVTSGSTQPASPKTAAPTTAGKSKPHAAKKQAAAKIDFDLAELLKDPDKQAMLDRFCVTDGPGGFTQAETERMKAAFQRFKPEGGTEIDAIDDLEKILIHLGYLKVLPDVITRLVAGITQYATLDHTEYLRFMSSYAQYERDEVRKVFEQYDEDRSGSLTTEELEEVLKSFGVTPFRATIAYAISIVDEDESGTIDFKEFIHLLTVYRQTEGFTKNEVTKLYYVFDKFANPPKGVSLYKEIPADMLRESLMHMFGPQAMGLATKLANQVLATMEAAKAKKDAKRKREGMAVDEEQSTGMTFREFLVWARRLREAEVSEYRREFELADADNSGQLQADEMTVILKRLGYTPLKVTINHLMETYDTNQDGNLDFDDFITMMEIFRRADGFTRDEVATFAKTFKSFDPHGHGEVGVLEIAEMMRFMGLSAELEQAESFVKAVDFNDNNSCDFREFLRLMRLYREEELAKWRKIFNSYAGPDGIPATEVHDALDFMGVTLTRKKMAMFLAGAGDAAFIDFDAFVGITDGCRKLQVKRMQKQAGFADEEIDTFRESFDEYDKDKSGFIDNKEMFTLVQDLGLAMRTVEDQKLLLALMDEARVAAIKGGVTEEEIGPQGLNTLSFWTFVHLLRGMQTHMDKKKVRSFTGEAGHSFNNAEIKELGEVFAQWMDRSRSVRIPDADDSDASEDWESAPPPELKEGILPFKSLWGLYRQMGVNLTPAHREQLKGKIAMSFCNTSAGDNGVDFNGFLGVMTWMLDSNFANIKEASDMMVAFLTPSNE